MVWRKLVHKPPRPGHFHAEFRPFWSVGIMTKNAFRPISSIYFIFRFDLTEWFLWTIMNILWWFGGIWSINGQDLALFMPNFSRFWSVASWQKMLLDLVSLIFLFHFDCIEFFLWKKKENSMVVWRKLIHKWLRFGHFHTKFQSFC